jgi:nicotinamidase-related amidase
VDRAIEPESTALLLVDVQNAVFNDKQAADPPGVRRRCAGKPCSPISSN